MAYSAFVGMLNATHLAITCCVIVILCVCCVRIRVRILLWLSIFVISVIPAAMHGGFFVIFLYVVIVLITSVLTYLICMLHSKIIEGLRERTEYIDIFLFFPPITQLCSVSDVLFTGGRGVSDFSLLK